MATRQRSKERLEQDKSAVRTRQKKILRDIRREKEDKVAINQLQQAYLEMLKEELRIEKQLAILAGDTGKLAALEAEIQMHDKRVDSLDKELGIIKSQNETRETSNQLIDGMASKLGIAASTSRTLFKDLSKNFLSLKASAEEADKLFPALSAAKMMAGQFGRSLLDAFHPLNVIESTMSAIWTASVEFYYRSSKALASFAAAAGDLGTASKDVGRAMNLSLGVNIEHAAAAAAGLASSFTEFTSVSGPIRSNLITTAAALERMGISAQESGAQMTYFVQAAGMSIPQAEKQMQQLSVAAAEFGKTPAQFASEFASASKSLAAHGPKMLEVFLDLESVAKASGIAMDTLLGIADKFDTFDTAASSVGNLNALMGGDYLNTLEMMNMTEKERISALKEALFLQGRSFDQMERFERKAIAESIGTDEQTLAQMMGYSTRESRKARREADEKMRQDKAYQKMLSKTIDIAEALSFFFQGLFAQTGLMEAFSVGFNALFKSLAPGTGLGDTVRKITGALGDFMGTVIVKGVGFLEKFLGTGETVMTQFDKWLTDIEGWFDEIINSDIDAGQMLDNWVKGISGGLPGLANFFSSDAVSGVSDAVMGMITKPLLGVMRTFQTNFEKDKGWNDVGSDAISNVLNSSIAALEANQGPLQEGMGEAGAKAGDATVRNLGDALGIPEGGTESTKVKAMGAVVRDSFKAGLDPEGMNEVTKKLVESTNEWATALDEVARAAKRVGENMGGTGEGESDMSMAPTAFGGFGQGQEIQLVLDDGEEFRAYLSRNFQREAGTHR